MTKPFAVPLLLLLLGGHARSGPVPRAVEAGPFAAAGGVAGALAFVEEFGPFRFDLSYDPDAPYVPVPIWPEK